jgi:hypothetical protein
MTSIRFTSYPQTIKPPDFVAEIAAVFTKHEPAIATTSLVKGLVSNEVLEIVASDLRKLGFTVEAGPNPADQIDRPVFFGENGVPTLRYKVDAYHSGWRCGLEVEAGRAFMGNAFFRDLVQGLVMTDVDHLCIAVPNEYRFNSGGKPKTSRDYDNANGVAAPLFGHERVRFPYGLTVLGY